jgi:hypothetical protein
MWTRICADSGAFDAAKGDSVPVLTAGCLRPPSGPPGLGKEPCSEAGRNSSPRCKALSQGLEAQRVQREALARGEDGHGVPHPFFSCKSASPWSFCYSHTRAPNTKDETRHGKTGTIQETEDWRAGSCSGGRAFILASAAADPLRAAGWGKGSSAGCSGGEAVYSWISSRVVGSSATWLSVISVLSWSLSRCS